MRLVRVPARESPNEKRLTALVDHVCVNSLNPIDLCNKLNQVRYVTCPSGQGGVLPHRPPEQFVLPEMIAHAIMTASFLLSFQVIAFLLNAPLLAYNVNKYALDIRLFLGPETAAV